MNNYYEFGGMHIFWWIIWCVMIFWIFATPYDIPGQRTKRDTPLYILKKRMAAGEISIAEYEERKSILLSDGNL
jgi:putative membrane protein